MSSPSIPAPATEPDPSSNSDWDPSPGESISGVVHDREQIETKYGPRVVLSISTGGGEVTRVPCFRTHLRELLALNDPSPGDGISISYFGTQPGGKKQQYAMRVTKQGSLLGAELSETAKVSRAVNTPLDEAA